MQKQMSIIRDKENRLVQERDKIRSDRSGLVQGHKKDLESAVNSASRNMTIASALAFIAGLMLASFFLTQEADVALKQIHRKKWICHARTHQPWQGVDVVD